MEALAAEVRRTEGPGALWLRTGALFGLALFAYSLDLDRTHLAPLDDCYYAQKAREMLDSGDWWTPTWAGVPRFDNPPLMLWWMASSFAVFGVSEWSAILPSALAGAGCVALLYHVALRLAPSGTALAAALVLFATPYFGKYARHAMFDTFVTLTFLVSIYAALRATGVARTDGGAAPMRGWCLVGLAVGAGVLTKSALGLLPLLSIAVALVATGRARDLSRRGFASALAIAAMLAAPWYASQLWSHADAMWSEHFQWLLFERAFSSDGAESGYPLRFARSYWPWLPVAVFGLGREALRARDGDVAARWLLAWVLPPALFLSLSDARDLRYLLPIFPALSLITARALFDGRVATPRQEGVVFAVAAVVVLALAIFDVPLSRARRPELHALAVEAARLSPEGRKVAAFKVMEGEVPLVFLFYSGRALAPSTGDPETFVSAVDAGSSGLVERESWRRHFAQRLPISAQRGRWLLVSAPGR